MDWLGFLPSMGQRGPSVSYPSLAWEVDSQGFELVGSRTLPLMLKLCLIQGERDGVLLRARLALLTDHLRTEVVGELN